MLSTWSPPRPGTIGDCSAADLALIHQYIVAADGGSVIVDGGLPFFSALSIVCQRCVGTQGWQPVLARYDGTVVLLNPGACYVDADGGSFACGKAVAEAALCTQAACSGACSLDPTCEVSASSGTCAAQHANVIDGCGAAKPSLDDACGDLESQIAVVCGGTRPPLPDAGPFAEPPPSPSDDVEAGADWDGDPGFSTRGPACGGFSVATLEESSLGRSAWLAGVAIVSLLLLRRSRRR